MPTTPHSYAITPAAHLVTLGQATVHTAEPAAATPDPIPPYGDLRTPTPGALTTAPPILRYTFHNSLVHGPEGAITLGRRVVAETLGHTPAPFAVQHGPIWIARHAYVTATLPAAEHLLCAVPQNHFHWLLDGLARQTAAPENHSPPLLSPGPPHHLPARIPAPGETLAVTRLAWNTSLTSNGGAYHPAILRLRPQHANGPPDLYISRADATHRPLRNEPELQSLCAAHGFTPITLSGMTLEAQIALFAAARRIVAPHGAGLANIVFCRPGAAILELMMDQYANLCFRRLAATAGLRWGCLIGPSEPGDPNWVHATGWTLPPARLQAALNDPAFQPTP